MLLQTISTKCDLKKKKVTSVVRCNNVALGHRKGVLRKGALNCHLKRSGHESGKGSAELQCQDPEVERSKAYFRN